MFGIEIYDAGLMPSLFVALLAGVLSFLSPCVLPIVPPYLAYMGGISMAEMQGTSGRRRLILPALFFVMGLSVVFLLFGFAASAFSGFVNMHKETFTMVSGAVVALFGLHFLGILRIPLLYREARLDAGDQGGSALGAFVLGLAFAFGWTPCMGPMLGAILSLAAQEGSTTRALVLLGAYAAGLGVPFFLVALFIGQAQGVLARMRRHMALVEKLMGLLLLLVGLALLTGVFTDFSWWLVELFQSLGVPLVG